MIVAVFATIALVLAGSYFPLRRMLRAGRESERTGERCGISVILPARDEAENLKRHLPSLKGFDEVIVVDDGSNDGTADVARELGARVVTAGELPAGWTGKTRALVVGAAAAECEWLLFLDADVWVEKGGRERLEAFAKRGQVTSICPYHEMQTWWERLSLFFNVLMAVGGRDRLYGQTLLVHREDYEKAGTHAVVRGEPTENLAFALQVHEAGLTCRTEVGGVMRMRMFPEGVRGLCRSWQKSFLRGGSHASKEAVWWSSAWASAGMFALVAMLMSASGLGGGWWALAAYGAFSITVFGLARRVGNYGFLAALCFPVLLLFYQGVVLSALLLRNKSWKGRHVD